MSKKLQSFYGGPFIFVKKFLDALYDLAPFGNHPLLQGIEHKKILCIIQVNVEFCFKGTVYEISPFKYMMAVESVVPVSKAGTSVDEVNFPLD